MPDDAQLVSAAVVHRTAYGGAPVIVIGFQHWSGDVVEVALPPAIAARLMGELAVALIADDGP